MAAIEAVEEVKNVVEKQGDALERLLARIEKIEERLLALESAPDQRQ